MSEYGEHKDSNLLFRFKSIRNTMIFFYAVLIISALLVFLLISLNYTEETVMDNSKENTMQLIQQVNADIDSYINYMENISQMVSYNGDVKDYLFSENSNQAVRKNLFDKVVEQFRTVMDAREDIYNIAVVADNGRNVINEGNSRLNPYVNNSDIEWYQQAVNAGGNIVLSPSHVQNMIENDYRWVVTLSRGLKNPATGRIEGVFFIDLNYSAINNLCEKISLGSKGYVFILDKEGRIIYHPQQQLLYSGLKEERINEVLNSSTSNFVTEEAESNKRLYTMSKSEKTGWTVVGVAYTKELMGNKEETQLVYLLTAMVLLVSALGVAVILSSEITKPIKVLRNSMKEIEKGNFEKASIEGFGENEIGALSNSFNIMTEKIQELMRENVEEQKEKRKSELKALQSQINPHFLYNTLDSIIWMAEGGKNQEVVLMTSSLAKLLRQSISNEDEVVTISKEIGYTFSYLTIQKMRYKDRLEFDINVDEEILDMRVIKLVLQPLVENAIYHGIKYKEGKGMVWITGGIEGDRVVLKVRDNGIGMDEDALEHIFEYKESSLKTNGVGVNNVNNRIKLYYGREYGLEFESEKGKGTSVSIILPKLEKEERENGKENEKIP